MPAIVAARVRRFLAKARKTATTAEQGRALENLLCYVFRQVPGVIITHRNKPNVFRTEEIDIAIWNDGAVEGLAFLPEIFLVECKHWSSPVGSSEVSWFDAKLKRRGLTFGILISPLGITGRKEDITAARSVVAAALWEKRRLIVLTTEELLTLADSEDLVRLIKTKLCDLIVTGTIA